METFIHNLQPDWVSVVIPSYNRAATLPRAIDSVLQQQRPVDEIIVVDDGSSDGTAEMLAGSYPMVTLIQQPNRGVSAARNQGIRHTRGEWIALLDSDDAWLPNRLTLQLEYVQQQGLRFCHGEEIWIRNGKRVNAMHKHRKEGGWIFPQCLPLCVISPSASLIHRDVFSDYGLFDEDLPACEDYDLWLRICAHEEIAFVSEPVITKYGGHADQLSRQHWGMDRFRVRAIGKLMGSTTLKPEYIELCRQTLLEKAHILLKGARKHSNTALIEEMQQLINQLTESNVEAV